MKKRQQKIIAAFLAFVMVFLTMPIGTIAVLAEEVTVIEDETARNDLGFLGYGYNVLGDKEIKRETLKEYIFNDAILLQTLNNSGKEPIKTYVDKAYCGYEFVEDISTYIQSKNKNTQFSVGAGVDAKIASVEAKVTLGLESFENESGTVATKYAMLKAGKSFGTMKMDLDNFGALYNKNNEIFNQNFIDAVLGIATDKEIEAFIDKYGTHILVRYTRGGEGIGVYKGSSISKSTEFGTATSWEIGAEVGFEDFFKVSASYGETYKNSQEIINQNGSIAYHYTSRGSDQLLALPLEEFTEFDSEDINGYKEELIDFVNGITEEHSDLLVDDNLELVPIWDLLRATGDASLIIAANLIEKYSSQKTLEDCEEFYEDYLGEVYYPTDVEAYDWLDREPDSVTIITNAEQLASIGTVSSMPINGVYVLANNIDLSGYANWTPIGTSAKPFMGIFYGNYNTVKGLNIIETTDGYAGLFGYVGRDAYIDNLSVEGNIAVSLDEGVNIGAVAAYCTGTVKNCYDNTSYNIEHSSLIDSNKLTKIDLSASEAQTISIGNQVGIQLTGSDGVQYDGINIILENCTTKSPVYIVLENANIKGTISGGGRPVYIISTGVSNYIGASDNSVAIDLPNDDITILGDAPLIIEGGRGANSQEDDANGYDGTYALIAKNIYIDVDSKLTILGGEGESGDEGETQVIESVDEDPPQTADAQFGGDGGDGGIAINSTTVVIRDNSNVEIIGGNGGHGGNGGSVTGSGAYIGQNVLPSGGDGGDGGNGGMPIDQNLLITASEDAAFKLRYGDGGNGGNGGDGGDAANKNKPDKGGHGGHGGTGGFGYIGGHGGKGGAGGSSCSRVDSWTGKPYLGVTGDGGYGGAGGNSVQGEIIFQGGVITHIFNDDMFGKGESGGPCGEKTASSYFTTTIGADRSNIFGSDGITIEEKFTTNLASHNSWMNNYLQIESTSKTEFFSGETVDNSTVTVSKYGEAYKDYTPGFSSYCPSYINKRIGYIYISDGSCERYIPVYVTKSVENSIQVIKGCGQRNFVKDSDFSVIGLKILVSYNNPKIEPYYIDGSDERISYIAPDMTTYGQHTVELFFDHDDDDSTAALSTTYDIYVDALKTIGIEIAEYPLDYHIQYQGAPLKTDGLIVKRVFNNGEKEELNLSNLAIDVSPSLCTIGKSTVTISYGYDLDTGKPFLASYEINIIEISGFDHNWDVDNGHISIEPTHMTKGEIVYTCTVEHCGATKAESIPTLECHVYGDWYKLNDTQHQRMCECGDTVTLTHTWNIGVVTEPATHLNEGTRTYTCTACYATKTETIDKLTVHSYGDWTKLNDTQHKKVCACGDVVYENHTWDSGVITTPATQLATGVMTYTCTAENCDAIKTEVISKLEVLPTSPQIVIDSKTTRAGETVKLDITMKNVTALKSILLDQFDYDKTKLELVGFEWKLSGAALSDWDAAEEVATIAFNQNVDANGVIAELTFKVLEDTEVGNISVSCTIAANEKLTAGGEAAVTIYVVDGCVTVTTIMRGDVNGDDFLDSDDAIYLLRSTLNPNRYPSNQDGDMNGDGFTDSDDAIYLLRHTLSPSRYPLS